MHMKPKTLLALAGLALTPLALAAPDTASQAESNASIEQQLRDLQAQMNALKTQQAQRSGDTSEAPDWVSKLHFHGFGTFGLQVTNAHDGTLYGASGSANQKPFPGVNDRWEQRGLSRAGLQVSADLDADTQLVTQFLARGADDYAVRLQWAYLSHKFTPDITVRAGRLVLPFYMHSQYHDVGYAYPWVSLPDEVYNTVPGDTADGIDLSWNVVTGPVAHTFGLQWANTDIYTASADSYHVQDMVSVNLTSSWGSSLQTRFGYSGGKVDHSANNCPPYLNPADPADAVALATCRYVNSQLKIDKGYAYFANAGFKYDDGRFLLTGEWVQLDVSGYFPLTRSSYTTVGMHLGRWLPTFTYGMVDTSNRKESNIPGVGLVAQQQQRRLGYGLRYDATSNVSLKAELNQIYGLDGTPGLFARAPAEGSTNLFRLSVDATF